MHASTNFSFACICVYSWPSVYQRADRLAGGHAHDVAVCIEVKHDNRQTVVAAHRDGSRVHHAQTFGQNLEIRDFLEFHGVGVLERVLVVDTVDTGGLGDHLCLDFECAQGGGGIG